MKAAESVQKQAAMLQSSAHAAREAVVQTTRYQQAAKAAQATAQKASQAAGRALRAILSAARSLAAAMMAGGSTVLSMVLVICLIGLLIASPFGIFFSGEDSGTGYTMPEAVTMLNTEFTDRIEQIKAENPHDELDMDNAGSAAMISNWRDVLAVYAVRTTTDASSPDEVATLTEEKLEEDVLEIFRGLYEKKEEEIGSERMREVEKMILLRVVDNHWMEHIDAMDDLKQGIGLRALGQINPANAYAAEGFDMFEAMVNEIREEAVRHCYNVTLKTGTERRQIILGGEERKEDFTGDDPRRVPAQQGMPQAAPKPQERQKPVTVRRETPKVGRNDPCPCGSGKKYKNCCGK